MAHKEKENYEKMKAAYRDKLEAKLREYRADIDKMKAKADGAEAGARIEYYKQIEMLNAKLSSVEGKLLDLKSAGEEKWESAKAAVEHSWGDLKHSLKDATSKIK